MILPVLVVVLLGRLLPTWTLSLATVAASNAMVALGIVVLARTGNVSFGQVGRGCSLPLAAMASH